VCLSSTKFEQNREGWLFALSSGLWSQNNDGTFTFGQSPNAISIGHQALQFFNQYRLGQKMSNLHLGSNSQPLISTGVRVLLDRSIPAPKMSKVDIVALEKYYRGTGNAAFRIGKDPEIQWLQAFYCQAAGQFIHKNDNVFIDKWLAKITRLMRHNRKGKKHLL
jgi:hypothetical protein